MSDQTQNKHQTQFEKWWFDEGSGMSPKEGEEQCDHVKRISEIAWSNGGFTALMNKIEKEKK